MQSVSGGNGASFTLPRYFSNNANTRGAAGPDNFRPPTFAETICLERPTHAFAATLAI